MERRKLKGSPHRVITRQIDFADNRYERQGQKEDQISKAKIQPYKEQIPDDCGNKREESIDITKEWLVDALLGTCTR